jgi:predicted RNase H-like HicB family nuclease
MKSYVFPIRIEPDEYEDGTLAFSASCEILNVYTFGDTYEEALAKIHEAIEVTLESMIKHGDPIPVDPVQGVMEFDHPVVAVTV